MPNNDFKCVASVFRLFGNILSEGSDRHADNRDGDFARQETVIGKATRGLSLSSATPGRIF